MRKTLTTSTVRRRVGMAAIGAAAIAAVAVPGAAWANDDAPQEHSTTVVAEGDVDFQEMKAPDRSVTVTANGDVDFQEMKVGTMEAKPGTAPEGHSVTITKDGEVSSQEMQQGGPRSEVKVLNVSAEELQAMIDNGEVVPATPMR
ncbi:hypothetical protein [Nocardia sp. NPDC058666]|uniref:hypothetical protein n=1 Tax=Nocardia sp. NPDC058666 TaxID=3346587 RepID=UPI003663244F